MDMDPDVALTELRKAVARFENASDLEADVEKATAAADEMARQVRALDEWLAKGGFLPRDWATARKR